MTSLRIIPFVIMSVAAQAAIIYEHVPESNSNQVSFHSVGGPVLADDLDSAAAGWITQVEWWGTSASSTTFEITLHFGVLNGGAGSPQVFPANSGGFKYFVDATGVDPENDGIFYYTATLPGDFFVEAGPRPFGEEYWFSVANSSPSWTWAYAGAGPTVGDEHWNAVVSTGIGPTACPDGGPHCGPWTEIQGGDFAFRLTAIPEPGAGTLLAAGAGLMALSWWRKGYRTSR